MSDPFERQLSDYVDGALTRQEAAGLEEHLAACASCQQTVEQLRQVVARAGALGDRQPPEDLWPGITAQIERAGAPTGPSVQPGNRSGPVWRQRRFVLSIPQLAAAAVVLIAVSAGGMALLNGSGAGSGGEAASGSGAVPSPITSLTTAGDTDADAYGRAIAQLREAIFHGEGTLDSLTVRKLAANLETIDRAIEEARRALEADESDPYLRHHLAEARRQKVRYLRQTAALVAART